MRSCFAQFLTDRKKQSHNQGFEFESEKYRGVVDTFERADTTEII